MRRLDDFLIDRLFQPTADFFARWASCYAIAAFLLTGAFLIKSGAYVYSREWVGMFLSLMWMPQTIYKAHKHDESETSGVMPTDRIDPVLMWVRFFVLSIQFFYVPHAIFHPYGHTTIIDIAWVMVCPALYFMACRKNPPKQRRACVPFGAVTRGV